MRGLVPASAAAGAVAMALAATPAQAATTCSFHRGVTTCVNRSIETEVVSEPATRPCPDGGSVSGTLYSFYVVRLEQTTERHGRSGKVFHQDVVRTVLGQLADSPEFHAAPGQTCTA